MSLDIRLKSPLSYAVILTLALTVTLIYNESIVASKISSEEPARSLDIGMEASCFHLLEQQKCPLPLALSTAG